MSIKRKLLISGVTLCLVTIAASFVFDEEVSFWRCSAFDNYKDEMSFLSRYPDSHFKRDVEILLANHEKEYIEDQLVSLDYDRYIRKYAASSDESQRKKFYAIFPQGEALGKVKKFFDNLEMERAYRELTTLKSREDFLSKYPNSYYEDRVRAVVTKEKYEHNSLENGAQPYAQYYGKNLKNAACSFIIKSSAEQDYIVIVKYNNENGKVAGHVYVARNQTATIPVRSGATYQVFFYTGRGWNPDKSMSGGVRGGFLYDESFSYDREPVYMNYGETMEYTLQRVKNGNFRPSTGSASDFF